MRINRQSPPVSRGREQFLFSRVSNFSIQQMRRALTEAFRGAGLDSPELDARILVGHALGLDHAGLAREQARLLNGREQATIAALAQRRLGHEPVARIVGRKEFWSLDLQISAATLVPRPETESVVEAALAEIDRCAKRTTSLRIADLGTGSGAILLALLRELPNATGYATDINAAALAVARDNARRLGIARAHFVACDVAAALGGPFDLIVANPPYIASAAIAALPPEVREFDPRAALDGGADGLDFYRAIAAAAPSLLARYGCVVVELGESQVEAVTALFGGSGLAAGPLNPDLRDTARALVARKGA